MMFSYHILNVSSRVITISGSLSLLQLSLLFLFHQHKLTMTLFIRFPTSPLLPSGLPPQPSPLQIAVCSHLQ